METIVAEQFFFQRCVFFLSCKTLDNHSNKPLQPYLWSLIALVYGMPGIFCFDGVLDPRPRMDSSSEDFSPPRTPCVAEGWVSSAKTGLKWWFCSYLDHVVGGDWVPGFGRTPAVRFFSLRGVLAWPGVGLPHHNLKLGCYDMSHFFLLPIGRRFLGLAGAPAERFYFLRGHLAWPRVWLSNRTINNAHFVS